ncbi:MAG: aminodeoxychorismate synthase component I [Candidatus Margulisiibacteriota bacterium]
MLVQIDFEKKPLLFTSPLEVITCREPAKLATTFTAMEKALAAGYYLAGFISYEAGYAFETKLKDKDHYDFPLVQMGVYHAPSTKSSVACRLPRAKSRGLSSVVSNPTLNLTREEYYANIGRIKHYLEIGDTYEITYCVKFRFETNDQPYALYSELLRKQPVPYPAYIETDRYKLLSLSPELFMKKEGSFITTKPMKGTWPRSRDPFGGLRLHFDGKNRAENVMIADLLRNDLGRIGSNVRAPKLFEVKRYTTLYQMTSTVTATIPTDIPLYQLFKALHPSGSVTGAPKIRSMEIIRELENEERKIYTGAIGYITPNKDLFFNVPIRTILLEGERGEMGVGGGIVWDSTPEGEFEECRIKSRFLMD